MVESGKPSKPAISNKSAFRRFGNKIVSSLEGFID